jgi:hypothetical protein
MYPQDLVGAIDSLTLSCRLDAADAAHALDPLTNSGSGDALRCRVVTVVSGRSAA